MMFRNAVMCVCLLALAACGDDKQQGGPGDGEGDGTATTLEPDTTTLADTLDSGDPTDTVTTVDTVEADEVSSEDTSDTAVTTVPDTFEEDVEFNPCAGLCANDELCGFNGQCYCTPGLTRQCDIKIGDCKQGVRLCVDGDWTECRPIPKDEVEICDGHDNNCDGQTDEGNICVPPTLVCPTPRVVDIGEIVRLQPEATDPDGGELSYAWTLLDAPVGGGVGLEPPDKDFSELAPDASGMWNIQLCVTDDEGNELCCQTSVEVRPPCVPPPAPTIAACGTSWDRRPIVQFAPLVEGHHYAIEVDGQPLTDVSLPGQNYFRPADPIGVGGPPPSGVTATLGLRECTNATCCSEPATTTVALIETCTTPIAPSADNLIISEYLINGDGGGCPGQSCEAGEAIELTNLSHCPVSLASHHLRYCNNVACSSARRYDNFSADDVIPPRGVFVRIRNPAQSTCGFDFLPPTDNPGIFGIRRSTLELEVDGNYNNDSGWFNNGSAGSLRVATGPYLGPNSGSTILLVEGYVVNQTDCESVGFDALGACGDIAPGIVPTGKLRDNQLGRLWHPCDAVIGAFPPTCFQ